ncbi:MAG: NAD(P)/FAD-dependent oxidoreductase [Anaerolineae bacterium]|nr:NAD(P)/FAD-dependent oxidoreductase [Anaerolineae bacterium]
MSEATPAKSVLIIGAGIAGLCAGVYAAMNGYRTTILEMHTQAGGLCTSWRRRGYTIDGCIHWLVGSGPANPMHRWWQEVGLTQNRRFVDHEIYQIFQDRQGRTLTLYTDPDRLEKHLLELAPQDAAVIREFIGGLRFAVAFKPPMGDRSGLSGLLDGARFMLFLLPRMRTFQKWMKTDMRSLAERFSDPLIRRALKEMWFDDFSAFFMLMTFGWLQRKEAGYPIGGSLPMIHAVEERFRSLGGELRFGARVEKILVENNRAVGARLADGSELRADFVISAADGHATIYDMLEGRFVDEKVEEPYKSWKPFPPLVFIGMGVNRTFNDLPGTVTGLSFDLAEPVSIGGKTLTALPVHIYNFDPTLAPAGKTMLTVAIDGDYDYWKRLSEDRAAYEGEKSAIGETLVGCLEQRWPGISRQVEVVDVSTPLTFERYTGNWKGSFEGWLMTAENGMTPMKKTLPGLSNFYMVGQWVQPGGGLPAGVQSAREVLSALCKADGKPFKTFI